MHSGRWRAYWEQPGWGRQEMFELELHFAGGAVTGFGADIISPFVFTGSYDDRGNVRLVKRYTGAATHTVLYGGVSTGEGVIHGRWSIPPHWQGPFALRPVHDRPPPDAPIEEY
jgi:hypothetical protein